jgi:ribosome-binding protein aMBF1 (putative translation factor)
VLKISGDEKCKRVGRNFLQGDANMQKTTKKLVAINERGARIGEDHQNAILTDAEVELVRDLHDKEWSYNLLAKKFEVSKSLIAAICRCERRAQTATRWKAVHVPDD